MPCTVWVAGRGENVYIIKKILSFAAFSYNIMLYAYIGILSEHTRREKKKRSNIYEHKCTRESRRAADQYHGIAILNRLYTIVL